jgi:plastocyanin
MRTLARKKIVVSFAFAILLAAAAFSSHLLAQEAPVTAQIEIVKRGDLQLASAAGSPTDASEVVIWLSPLDQKAPSPIDSAHPPQLVQRNKAFEPHVLVVQSGTQVQFPNKDPFFHNVFSLFNGKRFDLGLYEAGSSKSVRFDRVGVSFLFCNIHEEMSAVIVAVDTPYFAISDRAGHISVPNVPDGRYEAHVWYERSLPDDLKALEHPVTISASGRSLETIRVMNNPDFTLAHKNKYGQDYVPPPATGYVK